MTENTNKHYFKITDYTYDNEFYIMTTNASEDERCEVCVFCNDPQTNIRDFESLVEYIKFDDPNRAEEFHHMMLNKWNGLGST